jgi:hypothetical protein
MCDWLWSLAHQLAMIYESLRDEIRSSGYMQADETPVPFQDPGSGKCGLGFLWVYRAAARGVLFEWFPSRAADWESFLLINCVYANSCGDKRQAIKDIYLSARQKKPPAKIDRQVLMKKWRNKCESPQLSDRLESPVLVRAHVDRAVNKKSRHAEKWRRPTPGRGTHGRPWACSWLWNHRVVGNRKGVWETGLTFIAIKLSPKGSFSLDFEQGFVQCN